MRKEKDPLKLIGLIVISVGAIILFSAVPFVQQAVVSFGPLEVTEVSSISATRMIIGSIGIFFGLVIYFGKEGLKIFRG